MTWKTIGAAALALTLTAPACLDAAWAEPGDRMQAIAAGMQAAAQKGTPKSTLKATTPKAETKAEQRLKAQREAMKALAFLDGEWRGASKVKRKDGWAAGVQTERVSSALDGTARLIEGRGFDADGTLSFNVLSLVTYDAANETYSMRSYSVGGRGSDHPLTVTADGFSWEQKSAKLVVRHEVKIRNGVWSETATRVPVDGAPETYVEFAAKRLGNASWPVVGAK